MDRYYIFFQFINGATFITYSMQLQNWKHLKNCRFKWKSCFTTINGYSYRCCSIWWVKTFNNRAKSIFFFLFFFIKKQTMKLCVKDLMRPRKRIHFSIVNNIDWKLVTSNMRLANRLLIGCTWFCNHCQYPSILWIFM